MDLDQDLKELFKKGKTKKSKEEIGKDIIFSLAKKLYKAESEIMKLIAGITDKTVEEAEELPMKETLEIIKSMLSEEGVLDFLSSQQAD